MKKRWTIFAAVLIIIGISSLAAYENNKRQSSATEAILNTVEQVDEVKISNTKETITLKGSQATPFIETRPLVDIEIYERNDRKLFSKEASYVISYYVDNEELYHVELLPMEEKPLDDHLDKFLINEQFMVKWGDYNMMFSQHEHYEKAITYFNNQQ